MLFPPDLRNRVRKDDMVHFVIEAVEQMDLRMARVNEGGSGSEQYPPSMMAALLIYCYAHGIFSSRKIETASYGDVAVRYLTGDTHPDHDTIATFRGRNQELFEQCFVQVLAMAGEVGVLQVGTVRIDGTKLAGNASKRSIQPAVSFVERVFGIIKEVLGFCRFHLRGLVKVETEWQLVCFQLQLQALI